ncbi:MAG TPA: biotin--[acetyl-CoA-carboxylase] ligase [Pseudonocardia sp.]|nr:biotin--[acetyl-CoA-carboxylase] ligase [Pseudonocardia sp.]
MDQPPPAEAPGNSVEAPPAGSAATPPATSPADSAAGEFAAGFGAPLADPLDLAGLRAALLAPAGPVAQLDVVARTGSTNADLLAAARAGAPDRSVLVAELQQSGRGRLDRRWLSPPGEGLTVSVLLRPSGVPPTRLSWLPLLAGVSLLRTVTEHTGLAAALKWPNDLLLGPPGGPPVAKCAGLLAEADAGGAEPAVVIGIGLNVRNRRAELPEGASSLHAEGAEVRRNELLAALLRQLLADEAAWRAAGGDAEAVGLLAAYRAGCATLGRPVRIEQPGGRSLLATALDVDGDGRLLVRDEAGATRAVAAGDVVHLRGIG